MAAPVAGFGSKFSMSKMAVYTSGNMIGTGTHQTLIALALGGCGNLLWANFLLAGLLVTLSAWPLVHLYEKFPSNECLHKAAIAGLGTSWGSLVSFVNGQLVTIELVFAVTMQVSFFGTCFAAFFKDTTGIVAKIASLGLLFVLWFMYRRSGALFTANVAYLLGVLELGTVGMLILSSPFGYVAGISLRPLGSLMDVSQTELWKFPCGIHVAIFAYGGFPGMIQAGDLVADPRKNLPLGIVWACFMTTWTYVLMSSSVLLVSEPKAIAGFETAFDGLRGILPDRLLAVISCTVLSSVANNVMENSLVVIENLRSMLSDAGDGKFVLPNVGWFSADTATFGAVAVLTLFKKDIGLGMLGDAIDFALILQFAIFAVLSIKNSGDDDTFIQRYLPSVLSLCANACLGVWHTINASALPIGVLVILVMAPLVPSLSRGRKSD